MIRVDTAILRLQLMTPDGRYDEVEWTVSGPDARVDIDPQSKTIRLAGDVQAERQ